MSKKSSTIGVSRRLFLAVPLALAASRAAFGQGQAPAGAPRPDLKMGDDGLYHEDWFLKSFLDLADDLKDTTGGKKRFAILWEQRGCPYCWDLHRINFADAKITAYIRERFNIVSLNLWGDRPVTDFDGEALSEKNLARKYRINFTPTLQFFPETADEMKGKKGPDVEVARMPGYFRPFHFISMFEYVYEKRYAHQDFQRYIAEKSAARRGKEAE